MALGGETCFYQMYAEEQRKHFRLRKAKKMQKLSKGISGDQKKGNQMFWFDTGRTMIPFC
jgi:hypothetical protein